MNAKTQSLGNNAQDFARTAEQKLQAAQESPLITDVLEHQYKLYPNVRNHASIARTWEGVTVAEINQAAVDKALRRRQSETTSTGKPIDARTAHYEIYLMLEIVRRYVREHDLPKIPQISRKKFAKHPTCRPLTWDDILRLLLACHGYRWNGSDMEEHPEETAEAFYKFRPLYRLIIVMTLTGLSVENATALHFTGHPDGSTSYVDLNEGLLHRLGEHAPKSEKLKGMPVIVSKALLSLLKSWKDTFDEECAMKGARDDFIIYYHRGKSYNRDNMQKHLRDACGRAGLEKIDIKSLQSTHAWLALKNGATLRALAMARGESATTTTQNFAHFLPEYHQRPAEAFRQRPKSIR